MPKSVPCSKGYVGLRSKGSFVTSIPTAKTGVPGEALLEKDGVRGSLGH